MISLCCETPGFPLGPNTLQEFRRLRSRQNQEYRMGDILR